MNNYYNTYVYSLNTAYVFYVRIEITYTKKMYNYRYINDSPGREEDLRFTRLFNKIGEVVAKLPKKYEYSNGS